MPVYLSSRPGTLYGSRSDLYVPGRSFAQPPLRDLDEVQLAAGLLGPLPRLRPVEDVLVVDLAAHLAVALGGYWSWIPLSQLRATWFA